MELLHGLMNTVLPPIIIIALVATLPPYLAFKILHLIKRFFFSEKDTGKGVLVTGAASGIGEQIAYEYARRGACLVLVDIREDRLRPVTENARRVGSPDAIGVAADVSKVEDCKRFVGAAVDHFGRLDHLVNNAGIGMPKQFHNVKIISDFTPALDVNFWGPVYATHFATLHLRKSKGKIVVIASALGWFPLPGSSFYNASKAALISFYETLRLEIGWEVGITIIQPGLVRSELTQNSSFTKRGVKIPMIPKEECGKEIVRSACRGDRYLVVPFWVNVLFPLKVWCSHLTVLHPPNVRCYGQDSSS